MRTEHLLVFALLSSCLKTCDKPEPSPGSGSAKIIGMQSPLAEKPHFRLDLGPQTPCAINTVCETRLVLTALGDFHVNKDYPMKFVGEPSPGVELQNNATFALDSAKAGTLTVSYKMTKAGTRKLTGVFKLCVCTDENCLIETPKITFDVSAS